MPWAAAVLPIVAGLAGMLAGCATTAPEASRAVEAATPSLPEAWSGESAVSGDLDPAALAQWWERFGDPVLTGLVERALANSPDARTAITRIDEARAARGVQRSALFPSVNVSASTRRSETRDRDTDTTVRADAASAGIEASWEADLFGRLGEEDRAAASDLAAAREDFHAVQVALAAEVAATYVDLRAAEVSLTVARQSLALREESLRFNQWQEQSGAADALATAQAAASVAQARASVPALEQSLQATRTRLTLLCGLNPGELDTTLSATGVVPTPPAALAAGIPADVLRQRPDIRAAEFNLLAALHRVAAAERQRLPRLSLSGSIGIDALRAGGWFSPDAIVASAIGSVTAPIFNAGEITNTIAVRDAQAKRAAIAYEAAVRNALGEVEDALSAIQRQQERLEHLDAAVLSAREAADLARLRYRAGEADFLSVLDTERTLLGLEQDRVSAASALTTAHIQLYRALGGGWASESTLR